MFIIDGKELVKPYEHASLSSLIVGPEKENILQSVQVTSPTEYTIDLDTALEVLRDREALCVATEKKESDLDDFFVISRRRTEDEEILLRTGRAMNIHVIIVADSLEDVKEERSLIEFVFE